MSSLTIFYGIIGLLIFGFCAAVLTPIFTLVAPEYNVTVQLIIMIVIPVMSIALIYGVVGGGSE